MCRFVKFGVEGDAYQKTVADQFFEVVTAVVGFELHFVQRDGVYHGVSFFVLRAPGPYPACAGRTKVRLFSGIAPVFLSGAGRCFLCPAPCVPATAEGRALSEEGGRPFPGLWLIKNGGSLNIPFVFVFVCLSLTSERSGSLALPDFALAAFVAVEEAENG